MKKITLAAVLISMAVVPISMAAVPSTQTTEDTASIRLSGRVEKNVSITVSGLNNYDSLDLTIDVMDLAVVAVVETSNVREGYTVSLSSAHALAGGSGQPVFRGEEGNEELAYTVTYDGVPATFNSGVAEVTNSNSKTGLNGRERTLAISYSGAEAHLGNDFYYDDLTLTITAK